MRRLHRVRHQLSPGRCSPQLQRHPRSAVPTASSSSALSPSLSRFASSSPFTAHDSHTPSFSHLLFEPSPFSLSITLNRASVHNAFNEEVIAELTTAFTHPLLLTSPSSLSCSPTSPRCVILRSTGPSFSAGADLQWMQRMRRYSSRDNQRDAQALFAMLDAIASCPVPVIARVQGPAYGGGVGLIAACDAAFALHDAAFALSEVRLGLSPATISPFLLAKAGAAVGRYMLTGERFTAATAHRLGLVSELCEDEAAMDAELARLVSSFKAAGPEAVRQTKQLIRQVSGEQQRVEQSREYTTELIASMRVSEEGQEGIASFLERRPPKWKDEQSTGRAV